VILLPALVVVVLSATDFECRFAQEHWRKVGLDAPCVAFKDTKTPEQRVSELVKRWRVTEEQARCAESAATVVPLKFKGAGAPERFEAWPRCVEKWPSNQALWVGLIRAWGSIYPIEGLVAKLPAAPPDGGSSLAEQLLILKNGPRSELMVHLLKTQPQRLGEFLERDPDFGVAKTTLEQRRSTITTANWGPLALALMSSPLRFGAWAEAAGLWMKLPEPVRATVRAKPLPMLIPCEGAKDESRSCKEGDLRLNLALGLILIGQKDEARLIPFEGAKPLLADVVRWNLTGRRELSAWDAAITARVGIEFSSQTGDWYALLYPYTAPFQSVNDVRDLIAAMERPNRMLEADDVKSLARLKTLASQLPPRSSPPAGGSGPAQTLPTAPSPFVERAEPWKGRAATSVKAQSLKLPETFWPVRAEKLGKRLSVLAVSQQLDPVGEVSPGGFWLLHSLNQGNSWSRVYLGLGDHRPWHALETSNVPLIDENDVVRIAADDAPIRDETISFPPTHTEAPTLRNNVVLEAKLAELIRDTDRDGLSDIVEARMLLDSSKADTDGDGVRDGDDATPRLNDRLPATPQAELYNAFFARAEPETTALVTAPNSKNPLAVKSRRADVEDVRFLRGTQADLAGLKPLFRIVNLSEPELIALQKRFGVFYPQRLEIIMNGTDHALIEHNGGNSGGLTRADRDKNGKWVLEDLVGWES
jgi:hypothetical protein